MDIKFSKDSADNQPAGTENKGKQNVLLVVLLVLVGVFAYIYFFTGLIKPLPEQKGAESPPAPSLVAKQPLPSPEGTPPKAAAGEATKDAAVPAVVQPLPAAAPAPVAVTPVVPAKPAVHEAAKAKEKPKPAEEAQPVVKKPLPVSGKAGQKKAAPLEKKQPVVAGNKALPVKEVQNKPADLKKPLAKRGTVVAAGANVKKNRHKALKKEADASVKVAAGSGPWTVLVGNYVLEEALATDLARVRKAGLQAFVVPGAQKKTHMNRLFLAEFADRSSAQAELARLKHSTADAFMIDNAGRHAVYAGSYLLDTRAASEKERLAAAGFKLTVKRVEVPIPTRSLTAGSFIEKSAAEVVLKKLRAADVKATLCRP